MSERLTTEQKQLITAYRQQFAELKTYSDEQILSIINNAASDIKLSEDEQVSILYNNAEGSSLGGLALETKPKELTKEEKSKLLELLRSRSDSVTSKTEEAESKNGFLGKAWNWTKNNLLDWCTDSTNDIKKAQKEEQEALKSGDIKTAFEKITGEEYNPENANKFLNNELKTKSEQALEGYEEGQEMAADFAGDMISGIAAVGIYMGAIAAAPFSGGVSIAVGLAAATASGGLIKSGLKALDASSAKREYDTFGKDMITGGFSGLLAPFTGGVGGAVGKGVATKLGLEAMKQVGKETVKQTGKQTMKTILTNPTGYEYAGGTALKRVSAYAAEMATDGALGGAIDGTFREGVDEIEKDGELDAGKLGSAFVQGTIGGLVAAPAIGGGMKGVGKAFNKIKVAMGGGKTVEINEAFGLGYIKPESNLEKGHFTLNGKKLASNKKDLLAQLEEAGIKSNWDSEYLIKMLKTEEDFNNASVLLTFLPPYYARESFSKVKTLDEAVVRGMLLKNGYNANKAVSQIVDNPLLFNIYQETNTVMGDRYSCILERTIAEKLKTPEKCEAYLHVIKNCDNYLRLESLYENDFVPKNIEDANSYISILNYFQNADYGKCINSMKEFLSLPPESRSVLEKYLKPKDKKSPNSQNVIRQETFVPILKGLQDNDARASLTRLLEKVDDFEDIEYIYRRYLSNSFSEGIYDKDVINRLNRILATGTDYKNSYETQCYLVKSAKENGERVFQVEQKSFENLIDVIEDKEIQEKLGRVFTVSEADSYCFNIKTDVQRRFFLDNICSDTEALSDLSYRAGFIQNEEQIPLAKFFLGKGGYFRFHEESSPIHIKDLHENLKTKEEVETFLNLAKNKSNMTLDDAEIYIDILEDNINFVKRVKLIESIPELKTAISSEDFYKFISHYFDDISIEMLKEINKLIKNKPQLADNLSELLDYSFYSRNFDESYLARFKRNVEFLSNADDKILSIIPKYRRFTSQLSLIDFLDAKNLFDVEKFNKYKPLLDKDSWSNNSSLFNICVSCLSVEEIDKLLIKTQSDLYLTGRIAMRVNEYNKNLYSSLVSDNRFSDSDIIAILARRRFSDETEDSVKYLYKKQTEFYDAFCNSEELSERFVNIISSLDVENSDYAINLCKNYKKLGIPVDKLEFLISHFNEVDPEDMAKLIKLAGKDFVNGLFSNDLVVACNMVEFYGSKNINEIPISSKNNLLKKLVACNTELFHLDDEILKRFPLLPKDQESYCSLLTAIVRSIGIETNPISPGQLLNFNNSVTNLSKTISKISDKDFANLKITQEFSREQFINIVLEKTKNLSSNEKQKVFDYFGFELSPNDVNETGFSIKGYPVNLNNGKKLAQIDDPNTKAVVESLRKDVVKFSEQNPIRCSNPTVEKFLNDIVEVLPEIRTQIGKTQHGTHAFDVVQHSLKVMQKFSQDSGFEKLNDSDKKIMLLTSLMHDITKVEGISDKTHATESSFDSFFIAKKFNLTRDEEIKLFTLIRQHEWLGHVNTAKSEEELTKRLQSVAYDLRHDNMFEMALMFTHADLKAVKVDDSFHNSIQGASRARFKDGNRVFEKQGGTPVSHGDVADIYAQRIRGYIDELKISQPLLPVTRIPKASNIRSLIQKVYPDGTTDIKGVYVDTSTGLVVVKYNEVENWQALGFPEGTVSRGYQSASNGSDINTGNIKFFVHGLDYVNQLAKFDAFNMVDSDVLLSVSYAERPESKYRFFRTQGVILDVDTKYIHGGGETDAGSGCGKFLDEFKNNYLFGGYRESDRTYVANLIKEATGMNDKEYIEFVKANENKAMHEVEPAEIRQKIIDAFATINSHTRRGERAYNEMYLTNPEVMGVFAYPSEGEVGHALDFLNGAHENVEVDKINFLKEHALERDLPFIVFGD